MSFGNDLATYHENIALKILVLYVFSSYEYFKAVYKELSAITK